MASVLSSQENDSSVAPTGPEEILRGGDNLMPMPERVGFAVVVGAMAVAAVTGNTLVCLTFLRFKMPARHFLINLAISDIIVGGLVMPCGVVTLLLGRWIFGPVMCEIVAFLKTTSLFSSALTFCVIAVDRYLSIKNVSFKMTLRQKVAGLIFPWLSSGLTALGPLLGWGDYLWSPSKPVCTVNWLHSPSYTLFCFISFGFVPDMFIFCCYLGIAMYVHKKKKRVRKLRALTLRSLTSRVNPASTVGAVDDFNTNLNRGPAPSNSGRIVFSREEIGVLKTMVAVVCHFSAVAIPYVIMQLISLQRNYEFSLRAETISTTVLYLGACLNPVIYCGGALKFRKALKKTVTRLFKCRWT